jgi:hypothetical protein
MAMHVLTRCLSLQFLQQWRLQNIKENLYDPEPTDEGDSQIQYSSDNKVQEIFSSILLRKWKYVYVVEFSMQNIKLAFKLWNWLWFKQILIILLTRSRTQLCHELNEVPFHLLLVLSVSNILLHCPAVLG